MLTSTCYRNFQSVDGQHRALVQFREKTKVKKVCMMCTRHMNDTEFEAFEVQVRTDHSLPDSKYH